MPVSITFVPKYLQFMHSFAGLNDALVSIVERFDLNTNVSAMNPTETHSIWRIYTTKMDLKKWRKNKLQILN